MDVVTLADHAARQSDRWLFLAMLIVGLVAIVVLAKWFLADRKEMGNRLTTITDRHISQGEALAQVVANNTLALQRNTEILENCRVRRV